MADGLIMQDGESVIVHDAELTPDELSVAAAAVTA